MSSEYPPRSQKKTRLLQRMGDRFHRIKDAIMRPSSPRLSPGSVSHALPVSRPTTSPLIIGPRPCESDQQEIPLPSDPSASELLPGAHAEPSPKPEIADRVAPNRLIGSLQALEGSIGFPPLKLALSELIGCLDMMKASSSSLKDYEQLVDEFQSMADILKPYVGELESEPRTGSIANVTQCIQRQVMEIKKQAERGTIGRLLDATEDQQDVIRRYRQIENLFRQIQCDLSIRTRDDVKKQLEITLLRGMYPVDDARYNSGYSTTIKRRGCTPETREAIHRGLQEWAANLDSAKIYWMNGMAGTGKTTIAYSFCEWLESTHRLGSSFFCSRISSSCRSLNRIIPTLAYQLARYSPAFRSTLCTALNDNPDAGTLNVVQQFEMLINKPMLQIKNAMPGSVVIVIDALDECDDVYSVRLLLDVLLKFSRDLPVKFFVASRPEHAIRDRMMFQRGSSRTIVHLHDIEESIVEKDIKKYLTEALSAMQPPPSLQQIDQLAKRSRNLFIYAATVVRYIYPEDMFVNSSARLVSMLEAVSAPNATTKNRYEDLDRLYTTVLSAAFNKRLDDEEQDHMRRALSTIVCAREPLTAATIAFLATLTEDQVWSALQSLRSVVHVPENKGLISTLHASFPEYMLDEARSNGFYCDRSNSNQALLHRCFDVMKSELRFNICQLKNSYLTDDQIEDMEARVAQWISPTLSYACRYWGVHLTLSPAADNIRGMLLDLLYNRLLFWMEVLSLSGCIGIGAPTMSQAQIWLRQANSDQDETQKQVSDARNFLTWFAANPCSRSTPHIYASALPLCAKSSWVYEHYWPRTQGLGSITSKRDEAVLAIWSTESGVRAVSVSPDGDRIASGHQNGTIHIYDAYTGAEVAGPIKAHTNYAQSVVFSPSGLHIASGSPDKTVCIWDSYSGGLTSGPLLGHEGGVWSVAFSPDGTRIVSGCSSHTIIMWDTRSGAILFGPLGGNAGWIDSVAFSPDGRLVASGSKDRAIRLWDAYTGAPAAKPFMGHQGDIFSVAFSPDGRHIASGSADHTVQIWEVKSGANITPPLEGHTSYVLSVAYSPDGTHIISSSTDGDKEVIIWNALTGTKVVGPLYGHTDSVWEVRYTPDGTRAISCSDDNTIRIWDIQIKDNVVKQQSSREAPVGAVAFSSDYTRFISCSSTGGLHLWDLHTGDIVLRDLDKQSAVDLSMSSPIAFSSQGSHVAGSGNDFTISIWDLRTRTITSKSLKGHNQAVRCIEFSPDGAYVCSGSDDCTVIIWGIYTGVPVGSPCEGHTASVISLAYSPDGFQLVTGSEDKTVRVWNPLTGLLLHTFSGHEKAVTSVALPSSGSYIASGCAGGNILRWDLGSGDKYETPSKANNEPVTSEPDPDSSPYSYSYSKFHFGSYTQSDPVARVCFSSDSTRILAGSDSTILIFDSQTMSIISELSAPMYEEVQWAGFYPGSVDILSVSIRKNNSEETTQELKPNIIRMWRLGADGPSPVHSRSNYWSYEPDGRILSPEGMVKWVPPDLIPLLKVESKSYYNPFVLSWDGIIDMGYKDLCIGDRWFNCYVQED